MTLSFTKIKLHQIPLPRRISSEETHSIYMVWFEESFSKMWTDKLNGLKHPNDSKKDKRGLTVDIKFKT